ncbi:conserved hypothetical protein [Formosa agariphila KMM 3901]|uniref:Uncharacterized protein n=1 Tax=Formosa agariphila (strain DSM 15362 / KCTC 12365 / LMG 23005 / KMM 3901 / M-2Alg 35-1) TaxID=1347342 RepID=T2KPE9_FORAG|nr:hypothetical protein [Formosa agariphila]CDF80353.1 conserved hypothetical protein [Formosa agariphila KMM 3901]
MRAEQTIIILIVMFLVSSFTYDRQNIIKGDLKNWQNGEALIIFNDYILKEKIEMGTITSQGEITILLDDNYLANQKKAADEAKEKTFQNWDMKFNTVKSTFECDTEAILFENAAVVIAALPELEVIGIDNTSYGYLYCTNTLEIASWLSNFGQGNITKGYYLRWYFLEDNASVKGSCSMRTYTGNDDENYMDVKIYDLELQKGWNIVKYTITETFTSQFGKVTPSETKITRIDNVLADTQWILL